jgi:hypothetical protein
MTTATATYRVITTRYTYPFIFAFAFVLVFVDSDKVLYVHEENGNRMNTRFARFVRERERKRQDGDARAGMFPHITIKWLQTPRGVGICFAFLPSPLPCRVVHYSL